jgi:D-glycero-alpha-D-manno-heptose-7-phosphate kinase
LDRVIHAVAPVRVCDIGGWTDTWFARHGHVCNIAVQPGVAVDVAVSPAREPSPRVVIDAVDFDERIELDAEHSVPARHALLAAAVAEGTVPDDQSIEISITSGVPPGCATGTSAAVAVAIIAALDHLANTRRAPAEIAAAAHRVEVERLGLQSGVQDQLAAAHGGINHIEITAYPSAALNPISLSDDELRELERRLLLVYLGHPHHSSAVHERVVEELAREGSSSPRLDALRRCGARAATALAAGDWDALGRVMIQNTDAQTALHPSLVSDDARRVIALARDHGAAGWKVNGAGGDGGSLTVLCGPGDAGRRALYAAIERAAGICAMPMGLSPRGATCWES